MTLTETSRASDDGAADDRFMRLALTLAERGLGTTAPNPSVGAVIVQGEGVDAEVVGRGWTGLSGRPHAETIAIARAGARARGGTLYVTLEPCNHHGKTPPCTEAIVAAGIRRVVAAHTDPDPRVSGSGLAHLRGKGLEVRAGVCEREARWVNAGHIMRTLHRRPLVHAKLAVSADRMLPHGRAGRPVWVTGGEARARGHLLRAEADAIMVGAGTVLADDPELTCRLPGLSARSPVRVVLDRHLALAPGCKLVRSVRQAPLWVMCGSGVPKSVVGALEGRGVRVSPVLAGNDADDAQRVLELLAADGTTRLLLEGGARLSHVFHGAGLIDAYVLFEADAPLTAAEGTPLASIWGDEMTARLAAAPARRIGADTLRIVPAPRWTGRAVG